MWVAGNRTDRAIAISGGRSWSGRLWQTTRGPLILIVASERPGASLFDGESWHCTASAAGSLSYYLDHTGSSDSGSKGVE